MTLAIAAVSAAPPPAHPVQSQPADSGKSGSFADELDGLASPSDRTASTTAPVGAKNGNGKSPKKSNPDTAAPVTVDQPAAPQPALPLCLSLLSGLPLDPLAPKASLARTASGKTEGMQSSAAAAAIPETAPPLPDIPVAQDPAGMAPSASALPAQAPAGITDPSAETPNPPVEGAKSAAESNKAGAATLAFATRSQATTTVRTPPVIQIGSSSQGATNRRQPDETEVAAPVKAVPNQQQSLAATVAATYSRSEQTTPAAAQETAPGADVRAEAPVKEVTATSQQTAPLKQIVMHIAEPGTPKVDVQVKQQAGEVRIAVRTEDPDLAHGLRQSLYDLTSKLDESGFKTETWRPGGFVASQQTVTQARQSGESSRSNDSQSQPGWSQQDSGRRDQHQSANPHWVEDLESSMASGSSGESYGFSN